MAPYITSTPTGVLFEGETVAEPQLEEPKETPKYVRRIVWKNVAIFAFLHLGALYGVYLSFTSAKLATVIFGKEINFILYICVYDMCSLDQYF